MANAREHEEEEIVNGDFMKQILLALFILSSTSAFADYVCYPSQKNDFATDVMRLNANATKVFFREGSVTGEGTFELRVRRGHNRFVNFDHVLYGAMRMSYSPSGQTGEWFGEGYGNMHVEERLLAGADRGRMAISWCRYWCQYDYFLCYSKH